MTGGIIMCISKRIISLLMIVVMMVVFANVSVKDTQAGGTPYMNYKSVYVVVGKPFKVTMMNVPKGAKIKWRSTNKKVATVKNGKIKGVGKGNCKIKAKYKKKTYTCKVRVQENLVVTAKTYTKTTLNMINLKMDVRKIGYAEDATPILTDKKGTFRLGVYNTKKAAKWQSSNEKVAIVSKKGLVTAVGKGNCKISAVVAKKKISCTVTVTDYQDATQIAHQEVIYEILRRLNIDRIKVKAKPLKVLEKLNEIADIRAKEIEKTWGHNRPDGRSFSTIYDEVGFKKGKFVGENVAFTADKPEDLSEFVKFAYKHLYDEKAHRENMLNSKYECVGIGYYNAGTMTGDFGELMIRSYWSQEFYTK